MLEHKTWMRGGAHWRSLLAFFLTTAVVGVAAALVASPPQAGASTAPTARQAGIAVTTSSTAMNWSGLVNESYETHYTEIGRWVDRPLGGIGTRT